MTRRYTLWFPVDAAADDVFGIFFSEREQSLVTKKEARIAAREGESVNLFGGAIEGTVTKIDVSARAGQITIDEPPPAKPSRVLVRAEAAASARTDPPRTRLTIQHHRIPTPERAAAHAKRWRAYRDSLRAYLPSRMSMANRERARIVKEARALPQFLYPIEIFSRARALADLPMTTELMRDVFALAEWSPNPHTRRVGLTAIRFAERWDLPGLLPLLVRRLSDPAPWVRYDAAWILGLTWTDDAAALAGLAALAEGAPPTSDISDGDAQAQIQARESLANLRSVIRA